jgi:hypothetical protein
METFWDVVFIVVLTLFTFGPVYLAWRILWPEFRRELGLDTHNAKLTSPPQDSKDSEPPRFGGSG